MRNVKIIIYGAIFIILLLILRPVLVELIVKNSRKKEVLYSQTVKIEDVKFNINFVEGRAKFNPILSNKYKISIFRKGKEKASQIVQIDGKKEMEKPFKIKGFLCDKIIIDEIQSKK